MVALRSMARALFSSAILTSVSATTSKSAIGKSGEPARMWFSSSVVLALTIATPPPPYA